MCSHTQWLIEGNIAKEANFSHHATLRIIGSRWEWKKKNSWTIDVVLLNLWNDSFRSHPENDIFAIFVPVDYFFMSLAVDFPPEASHKSTFDPLFVRKLLLMTNEGEKDETLEMCTSDKFRSHPKHSKLLLHHFRSAHPGQLMQIDSVFKLL